MRDGEEFSVEKALPKAITPLSVQTYLESANAEEAADIYTIMIAEIMGVRVNTYGPEDFKKKKKQDKIGF
jgi:hypothetical protein